MQTINYKETEFQIRENTLLIKECATPLLVKFIKLKAEYLDDIDSSPIDIYEKQIAIYEKAISQIENDESQKEYCNELFEKLETCKFNFANDEVCNIIKAEKEQIMALMIRQLCCDKVLMKKLLSKLLIGDLSVIDWESDEALLFAMGAVTHFFLNMEMKKQE